MRKLLYITIIILSITSIVSGHLHWNSKITNTIVIANENAEEISEKEQSADRVKDNNESKSDIKKLTKNLSQDAKNLIKSVIESGEAIEVL